jgi:plasmid stability protein
MSLRITLPDKIEAKLRRKAKAKRLSVEELALAILNGALEAEEAYAEPEEVVMKIQATPPNPRSIRPATGSLVEALRDAPEDPDFDLASWNRSWAAVEADMKAITRANDIAEGRG